MPRVDWKGPPQIGGMLAQQLMTTRHYQLAGVQKQVQGAAHTQGPDETQEAGVPCIETRGNVRERVS
jgi:hypothetical protein